MELLLASPEVAAAILQLIVQFPAIVVLLFLVYRSDARLAELNANLSASRREEAAVHAAIARELGMPLPPLEALDGQA
jgi:hypothetical protein